MNKTKSIESTSCTGTSPLRVPGENKPHIYFKDGKWRFNECHSDKDNDYGNKCRLDLFALMFCDKRNEAIRYSPEILALINQHEVIFDDSDYAH